MKITASKFKEMFGVKKKSKYGNVRTIVDGINFHSKLESQYYVYLKDLQKTGHIEYFLMQVPLILPGGIKYLADFMSVMEDGSIEWVDIKGGPITAISALKIKQVEAIYPIKINIVRKGEF